MENRRGFDEEFYQSICSAAGIQHDISLPENISELEIPYIEKFRIKSLIDYMLYCGIQSWREEIDNRSGESKLIPIISYNIFPGVNCYIDVSEFKDMAQSESLNPEIFLRSNNDARIIFIIRQWVADNENEKVAEEASGENWDKHVQQEKQLWINSMLSSPDHSEMKEMTLQMERFTSGLPINSLSARTALVTSFLIKFLAANSQPEVAIWSRIESWNHGYLLHSGRIGSDGVRPIVKIKNNHEAFLRSYSKIKKYIWRETNLRKLNKNKSGGRNEDRENELYGRF